MIEQLLEYNREFVKSGAYEKFQTSKYPDKKIAILTCMDTFRRRWVSATAM